VDAEGSVIESKPSEEDKEEDDDEERHPLSRNGSLAQSKQREEVHHS